MMQRNSGINFLPALLCLALLQACGKADSPFVFSTVADIPSERQSLEFRDPQGKFVKELLFQNEQDTLAETDSSLLIRKVVYSPISSGVLGAYSESETVFWKQKALTYPTTTQYQSIESEFSLFNPGGERVWTHHYSASPDTLISEASRWFGSLKFSHRKDLLLFFAKTGKDQADGFVKIINSEGREIISVNQINGHPITFLSGVQIGWGGRYCVIHSSLNRESPYATDVLFVDLETLEMKAWPEQVSMATLFRDGEVNLYPLNSDTVTCFNLNDFFSP